MCNAAVVREVLQRIWEPWRWVKWPAIGSWQRPVESSIKLVFLKLHKQLLKNSSTILWSFSIWIKLEKWKRLISGCHISWLKIKKTVILTCCLLLFCATTVDHFLIGLWHVVKSGLYMITFNDQVSGWTEKKLQSASQRHFLY